MASQQLAAPLVGTALLIGVTVPLPATANDEIVELFGSPPGPVSETSTCPLFEKIAENPPGFGSAVVVVAERVPLGKMWKMSMLSAARSTTARSVPSGLTAIDAPPRPVPERRVVEFGMRFK